MCYAMCSEKGEFYLPAQSQLSSYDKERTRRLENIRTDNLYNVRKFQSTKMSLKLINRRQGIILKHKTSSRRVAGPKRKNKPTMRCIYVVLPSNFNPQRRFRNSIPPNLQINVISKLQRQSLENRMVQKNAEEPHTRLVFDETYGKIAESIREVVFVTQNSPSKMKVMKVTNIPRINKLITITGKAIFLYPTPFPIRYATSRQMATLTKRINNNHQRKESHTRNLKQLIYEH